MADEIRIRAQLSGAKSGRAVRADSGEISITQTGNHYLQTTQSVATTEEALVLGEVPPAGAHFLIENLDAANPVDLRPASGGTATIRIAAGRCAMGQFGPSVSAPFVIAITAAVVIRVTLAQT